MNGFGIGSQAKAKIFNEFHWYRFKLKCMLTKITLKGDMNDNRSLDFRLMWVWHRKILIYSKLMMCDLVNCQQLALIV